MPQMSPIYWLLLMFYFLAIMIIMMTFIYFSFLNKPSIKLSDFSKYNFNWKW
uniref:ATP synthase complex subunit 8 n=1 Tax=Planopleura kaempferi TaxID=3381683 RepID=A0A343J8E3_9HEMI|nr:ATP synthase F0 subunit 8 [Platypleura kaempferi]AWV83357.1 ATP synthase F0 subunit 8 [Platypleura kaempferi]